MVVGEFRLRKKKDFTSVFQNGWGKSNEYFLIKIKPNKEKLDRFGLVVSRNVDSKIVTRNKLKRRMREVVRKILKEKLTQGYDIVIVAKKESKKATFQEIDRGIRDLLKKLGILKNEKGYFKTY